MEAIREFFLILLQQLAGGPGPVENNLMRFGLAAVMWLILLVIAWNRQKNQDLPREKLLVLGFGLAFLRELIMFILISSKVTGLIGPQNETIYYHPIEHGLAMASIVVVAGAFLRYVIDDERVSRRYIQIGLAITFVALTVAYLSWPKYAYANPGVHFHDSWEAWIFHVPSCVLIAAAIFILLRKRDWLRVTVSVALGFLFISEFLFLVNYATISAYNYILCPISNTLHILAIPIFGYVYLKEQSIEKKKVERELAEYRDHLEELVDERTAMLSAQFAISSSLSMSLDLETILNTALDKIISLLSMKTGVIFILDRNRGELTMGAYRGQLTQEDLDLCLLEGCPYERISFEALSQRQTIIEDLTNGSLPKSTHLEREDIVSLISAPLISKNHVSGALTLGSIKANPLEQTDLELLTTVCNQVAIAVENAHLYREAEHWAEELSMLHNASVNLGATLDPQQINQEIATQSARLTGCQIACVVYWDDKCERLDVIASDGMTKETINQFVKNPYACELLEELRRTRSSIVISDVSMDDRIPDAWYRDLNVGSILCTPVWGINEPLEFLFLMNRSDSDPWKSKDIELVESFVSQAAVALENANLHKQLEWAAALEERQRIATNMHDGLAQTISLIGLKVDQTANLVSPVTNDDVSESFDQIRNTVSQASVEVRKSIASLQSSPPPKKSLQEFISTIVDQQAAESGETVQLDLSFDEPLYLTIEQNAQVIPIIQEALINIRKHSEASWICISGHQKDGLIRIFIDDNGKGFDSDKHYDQNRQHFGIRIMRARAARIGGTLQIISKPEGGTKVTLTWPHMSNPNKSIVNFRPADQQLDNLHIEGESLV